MKYGNQQTVKHPRIKMTTCKQRKYNNQTKAHENCTHLMPISLFNMIIKNVYNHSLASVLLNTFELSIELTKHENVNDFNLCVYENDFPIILLLSSKIEAIRKRNEKKI